LKLCFEVEIFWLASYNYSLIGLVKYFYAKDYLRVDEIGTLLLTLFIPADIVKYNIKKLKFNKYLIYYVKKSKLKIT
jgi:hypothetical protein